MKTVDDTLITEDHRVEREGKRLVFYKPTGKTVAAEREYGSQHAAVCAMGRCRADHQFANTVYANIKISELKGQKKSGGGQKRRGAVKMDYIALLAVEEIVARTDYTVEAATEMVLRKVKKRLKNEKGFEGVGTLRTQLAELNADLAR